jgi:hypothetical protein
MPSGRRIWFPATTEMGRWRGWRWGWAGRGERGEVTLHMPETNSIVIHDHTTRARTIIISTYELVPEDSMLSNDIIDYIILKNFRDDHECLGTNKDQEESKKVAQAKIDAQFNLDSTTLATRSRVH